MKLPKIRLWLRQRNNIRLTAIVVVVLIAVSAITSVYFYRKNNIPVYYVAYIGRYERQYFDRLHELALRKYLNELNAEAEEVKFELKTFDNDGNPDVSKKILEQISEDGRFVVVIDNSWGRELQPNASFIRERNLPVVSINADKQGTDFANDVVFLGHGDNMPKDIVNFSAGVLKNNEIIFITEENYPLTEGFLKEFKEVGTKVTAFNVRTNEIDTNERTILFEKLDAKLKEKSNQQNWTIVLNTHAYWGVEIINYVDKHFKGITILGGPYIVNWSNTRQFGLNENGNSVIMLTNPSDTVLNKVYLDLKEIKNDNPELSEIVNAQLFIKRCLDAVSILRGAIYDEPSRKFKNSVTRTDFIDFFRNKLTTNEYVGKNDLYEFDANLLVLDEVAFEVHSKGEIYSFPKQLNVKKEAIPNIYFGIELINISNINVDNRAFHADFFYWLKYDKDFPDAENYIHFRNEKSSSKQPIVSSGEQTLYKLYKMSGEFNIDFDFEKYPLDRQELKIELELLYPADRLRISFDHGSFEQSKKKAEEFNLNEWVAKDLYITVDNFVGKSLLGGQSIENKKPRRFKTLNVRMPVARRLTGPFVTIVLPLVMMGLAAVALLYVKDSSFSNIGEVCVGIFLSIVTYSIAFAQITPKSNVLTLADLLFYGTFFSILLIFLKVIVLNSSLISDRLRTRITSRATLFGHIALTIYCVVVTGILGYGLW